MEDKVGKVDGKREERIRQKGVWEIVGKNNVGKGEGKWARHVKEGAGRRAGNLKEEKGGGVRNKLGQWEGRKWKKG
jgi:hypothetical protein